ncbi:serine/threonine protein kinase [Actinobacteria bacterium YIM 96077]|uniref:non-specific serine/threonine protein kinase n=1 Tax=Phytoactinopolyspora halophila TaxID=1981511 RepID=A0A329QHB3_9ACTN|nr:serine/threonine-protein kinase [Phytoactinopolyspora halophila]AYY13107.1 serine/threonine protein kinase [Actinobacteria bacterium YIM 96077]RAW11119.1 serine/threonine protein kinase [Phytoactinopolyspora halophila]
MYGSGVLLADRYQLDEQLGRGGMGEVWRATDQILGRTVAVKVMRPDLVAQSGFAQRFLAEARSMATVKHPAVVDIYDFHGDSSEAFLVMELIEGESLAQRIRRVGRIDPASAMNLIARAAEALHAAHEKGIVHRDVKPANLLVTDDDHVVLTDFGIARTDTATHLTVTGQVMGTPSYLAPEQVLGRQATPSSDVYALGVVAYECLTGRLPFSGENSFAVATQRLNEPPEPLDPDVPPDVATVVQRALAAEPDHRWRSARDLAEAARAPAAQMQPQNALPQNALPQNATAVTIAGPDAMPTQHVRPPGGYPPAAPPQVPPNAPTARATRPATRQEYPPPPTAATMRVQPDPQPVRPSRRQPPTTVQPASEHAAPPRHEPAATRSPDEPRRQRRPRSLIVACVLLAVASLGLLLYVGVLSSVRADVVDVVRDRLDLDYEIVLNAVPVAAWLVTALYGFLALMLLLLAVPVGIGSREARRWAYRFGLITLLGAAPLGVVAAIQFNRLEPGSGFWGALLDAVPSSAIQNVLVAGIITMIVLLVALVLLATRPVNDYIATRRR